MDADIDVEAAEADPAVNASPSLWDCVVAYRQMLRCDLGTSSFLHKIQDFFDLRIPDQSEAERIQQYLGRAHGALCTVVSSQGVLRIHTIGRLLEALNEAPTRPPARPGDSVRSEDNAGELARLATDARSAPSHEPAADDSHYRVIIIAPFAANNDGAAMLAVLGSMFNLDSLFVLRAIGTKPGHVLADDNTLTFRFAETGRLLVGPRCKRRAPLEAAQSRLADFTICFDIEGWGSSLVYEMSTFLRPTDLPLCNDDDVYLICRAWLRNFKQDLLRTIAPRPGAPRTWAYSELFETRDAPQWHLPVFELKAVRTGIRAWFHAQARRDGLSLKTVDLSFSRHGNEFVEEYSLALEEAQLLSEGMNQHMSSRSVEASDKSLEASLLSIDESQRGLEEAHAVMRLTQLAFVFLPLTFVTGVFGMNIKPFNGGASVSQFAITAGAVAGTAFAFGLWTERKSVRSILRTLYREIRITPYRFLIWSLFLLWAIVAILIVVVWILTWPMTLSKRFSEIRDGRAMAPLDSLTRYIDVWEGKRDSKLSELQARTPIMVENNER
jgi:hypothetical protein